MTDVVWYVSLPSEATFTHSLCAKMLLILQGMAKQKIKKRILILNMTGFFI